MKHHIVPDSLLRYVLVVLSSNTVYTMGEVSEPNNEDYLEYTYYMVPNHFILTAITDGEWEDKIYKFAFLDKKLGMLAEAENKPYHKTIERFLEYAPRHKSASKSRMHRLDTIRERKWTPEAADKIHNRMEYFSDKYDDYFVRGKLFRFYDIDASTRIVLRNLVSSR
ncbi:MAG: hypothetical protein FWG80_01860 [Alphaproteobacteria bacterium]|nr:hypothetical protein [Alphaproteobacteria bacterium]